MSWDNGTVNRESINSDNIDSIRGRDVWLFDGINGLDEINGLNAFWEGCAIATPPFDPLNPFNSFNP